MCVAALLFIAAGSLSANLVVNGGFETGNFSGWTLVDPSGLSNVGNDPAFAHSGTYHANLGTAPFPVVPFTTGSLSQNLATAPGTLYNLSFWLANDVTAGLSPFNSFDVFWNGAPIFSLPTSSPPFPYTYFAFNNLVATGPSTALEFRYRNDNDFFRLDDVSVVPDSMSTFWAALPVFGVLGLMHFRARRTKASVRV